MQGKMEVGLMNQHLVLELSVMFNCRMDQVFKKFQLVSEERCEEGNADICSFMFMCTEKLSPLEILEIREFIEKTEKDVHVEFIADLDMKLPMTVICINIDTELCRKRTFRPSLSTYQDTAELLYWPGIIMELDRYEEVV